MKSNVQVRPEIVVELQSVSRHYGEAVAVSDVSLEITRGELICLLGPSGCGKTTTLRMVAGFVKPSAGKVLINRKDMTTQPPYRRDTGMVFQSYALFPHMTVAENVAFGLENLKWNRSDRDRRVSEMLKLVELPHLAERLPAQLSGGQQQRIALARALALRPAVLLLDEPFSNLDAQLRVRMREELREVIQGVDVTTIFVTHDQEEALTMSDRIVVMKSGKIEQIGSPGDIYENPANPSVAALIGWCSVVSGQVEDGIFKSDSGMTLAGTWKPGKASAIIRPEHVKLSSGEKSSRTGRVIESHYYGGATRVALEVEGERLVMHEHFAFGKHPIPGDMIPITINLDAVKVVPSDI